MLCHSAARGNVTQMCLLLPVWGIQTPSQGTQSPSWSDSISLFTFTTTHFSPECHTSPFLEGAQHSSTSDSHKCCFFTNDVVFHLEHTDWSQQGLIRGLPGMSPAVGGVERKEQSQGGTEGFRQGRNLLRGEQGQQHGTDGMMPSVLRIRS